jgi:hypothetical protein
MSLSAYYGCLTADDIGMDYNECDAAIALFHGNYTEMVALLKETPDDLDEVLLYIHDFPLGIPFLVEAFPEKCKALVAPIQ